MQNNYDDTDSDSLEVDGEPKSSARVLSAIDKASRALNAYQTLCDRIDDIYGGGEDDNSYIETEWVDSEYDLFWASMEILKPAVYARPPKPVVSPQFKDRRPLQNTTAELLERAVTSAFDRTSLDEGMICARDDLIFYGRGQLWATYETDEKGGGQRVCVEHLDRKDFLHPPARKWLDIPWVARRAWLTREEMGKRFKATSGDAYLDATASTGQGQDKEHEGKYGVWEVWHKADNRVYWVAEGARVMLDEGEPHLKLRGFFPCPRPAYGTLRPRTLKPVPDYVRYAGHFKKINSLTRRIYDLLDMIRMKGLIGAGGEVGEAVEQAFRDDSNSALLINVSAAGLTQGGKLVEWLPLAEIATAIQGLIEARRELFSDYDRLSGISDIMRGETEEEETLGAQQLKSQYGSVRVKEKIDELQRLARDVTQIAAEIMADNFSKETLLDMSQMEIPSKADIEKQVKSIEAAAREELKELADKAKQAAQQAQPTQGQDPGQMQQMVQQGQQQFEQAQQAILAKYAPKLKEAGDQVPVEDVMKLLRDDKARGFAFEIETDSTVLTDEVQEKASRNEFLTVFSNATQGLMGLAAMGPAAAKLAGEVMKFTLQPYRVGRTLNSVIDEFIDSAPEMADKMAAAQGQGGNDAAAQSMAQANQKLAEAEMVKAQAKVMETQAKAEQAGAENQRKLMEAQATAQESEKKFQTELAKLQAQVVETQAKVRNLDANTQLTLSKIGTDNRVQDREDIKAVADIHSKAADHAMRAEDQQRQAVESDHAMQMGERQQGFNEQQGERQQELAERQAQKESA